MAKSSAPTEADLVFNRVSIAAARSRKLLESWSRPGMKEDTATAQTAEKLEEEDAEVFKPDSESCSNLLSLHDGDLADYGRTGAGYDGEASLNIDERRTIRADEKLRKLLGKNARQPGSDRRGNHGLNPETFSTGHVAAKARPVGTSRIVDSDEEEGRSSLGKSKRRRMDQLPAVEPEVPDGEDVQDAALVVPTKTLPPPSVKDTTKKPASYLDEVLAARSKKKKKKKGQAQRVYTAE